MNEEFDFRGKIDPMLTVETIKKVKEYRAKLDSGEIKEEVVLSFTIDHQPATRSIPDTLSKTGLGDYRILRAKDKQLWKIVVTLKKT
ncbi:MAG: hypothetical protein JW778_00500 [Candidatus Altiarchaeota archaeon]|nr:hypothetical protein [Candidatus Altiarchaeota archaeon]